MPKDQPCPECGRPFPADAPEEVCPSCSLQSLLKFVTADSKAESSPSGASAPATINPLLTARFGDYELLELLARGGMGVVYKARQVSLNRTVALKMIQAGLLASPAEIKRFQAEAEAVAHLQHPNIVAIHEIGEHEDHHFFTMDYVAGRTLAEVVRDGPLPAARAASYVRTIASAVHFAHQQGILHRDLKPANVIIDENDQPRITDFGLAKRLSDSQLSTLNPQLTLSGQVLGSPNYLPPEQADPKRDNPGPPSDVYALGAILYHLLTGRPPFQAESLTTLLRQVIETDPVTPRSLNPGIPRDLETICLKCLEKEPHRRYASAQALADDLERFLKREPVLARPIGASGRAWRWCRRQPIRAGLIGALLLVLVLGMAGVSWQWRRAEMQRDMALRHAYAGDMRIAQLSLEEGDPGNARRLLEKYKPASSSLSSLHSAFSADLCGWEWRYLWGLCRSDERSRLTQQTNGFANLALSPDGKMVALRQGGGNIQLWDWGAGRYLGTLTNQGWSLAMAFSPDGTLIASANTDRTGKPVVSFWDVAAQRIVRDLPQPSRVASLAFSPDGTLMATFHIAPMCSVWHLPSGRLLTNYATGAGVNTEMRIALFTPDGTKLVLGDLGDLNHPHAAIRCIELRTGAVRETPALSGGNGTTALAFSPDGQLLASGYGYSDANIDLWDAATGAPLGRLEGHRGWVRKLVFSPDGRTLYSAGADQSIRAWSIQQRREVQRWRGHTGLVQGLALSPDGQTLISCADDGSVRTWDARGPHRRPSYRALPTTVGPYGARFTADGRHLITVSASDPVIVWDVANLGEVERIPALGTNLLSVALSPDDRWLATGSRDGWIQIWDMPQRALVARFQASSRSNAVLAVLFLVRDNSLLSLAATLLQDYELRRWEAGSWREIPAGLTGVKFCQGWAQPSDGRRLVVSDTLAPAKLYDLASGRLEATFGAPNGYLPAFSADGRLLATAEGRLLATAEGPARVWDTRSRRQVALLQPQANFVTSVAFSPDGKRLATGSGSGGSLQPALQIWDYVIQRGILNLPSQGSWTSFVGFSPDGNTLLASSWDGVVELWCAPSWAEIEAEEKGGTN